MNVYLVRHGETIFNRNNVISGQLDTTLNQTGKLQALKAGKQLKDIQFDIAITSLLTRTHQTLKEITLQSNHTFPRIIQSHLLNERSDGQLEGLTFKRARDLFGDELIDLYFSDQYARPPHGESYQDCFTRAQELLKWLYDQTFDNVLIVGHKGNLSCLLAAYYGQTVDEVSDYKMHNCEIRKIEL